MLVLGAAMQGCAHRHAVTLLPSTELGTIGVVWADGLTQDLKTTPTGKWGAA
jgi:hypothetical protein